MGKINKNIDRITNRIHGDLELLVFLDGKAKHILVNAIEQTEEIIDDGQNPRKVISLKGLDIGRAGNEDEELFSVTYVVSIGGQRLEISDEEEMLDQELISRKNKKDSGPDSSFN